MKIGTTEKLKFKKLQRQLRLPLWQAVGLLESVWKMAYRNAPAGDIGRLSNEDIAAAIEWEGDADELVDALTDIGWLDRDSVHRLLIHDWEKECESWLRGNFEKHHKEFAKPSSQSTKQTSSNAEEQPVKQGGNTLLLSSPLLTLPYHSPPSLTSGSTINEEGGMQGGKHAADIRKIAKVVRPKTDEDCVLIARVAILIQRPDFPEGAVWDALEGTRLAGKGNLIAYWRRCLNEKVSARGKNLGRMLTTARPSPELLAVFKEKPDPRLCSAEDEE